MNRRRFLSTVAAVIGLSATRDTARAADAGYWEGVVRDAAARHGVSPDWLASVCACESGFDPNAVGKHGEIGIFQFMPSTFYAWGGKDVYDTYEQIEMAGWAFAQGLGCAHWVCAHCGLEAW